MKVEDYRVTVQARPEPLGIDPSKTALLVVDMQNDFGATGGMFDRAGVDIRIIQRVVEPIAKVLRVARAAHIPVIYIKMEHQPDLSDTGPTDGGYWVKNRIFSIGTPLLRRMEAQAGFWSRALGTQRSSRLSHLSRTTLLSPNIVTAASTKPASMTHSKRAVSSTSS